MKKILLLTILAMFLLSGISSAQNAEVFSRKATVALDSTDTAKVFIPFWAPRATTQYLPGGTEIDHKKLQVRDYTGTVAATQYNPPDGTFNMGNLWVGMYIDSIDAGDTDSLATWAFRVDAQGKIFGDTLHLDWITTHRVVAATGYWANIIDWEKHSAQADTFKCYYWVDFTSEYEPCFGIVIYFLQNAIGPTDEFRSQIRFFTHETR